MNASMVSYGFSFYNNIDLYNDFFKNDFGLNDEQVSQLHSEASQFDGDFETYLEVLQEKLADFPGVELRLMRALNSMMTSTHSERRVNRTSRDLNKTERPTRKSSTT